MDQMILPKHTMEEVLQFLSFTNRVFGGSSLVLRIISRWAQNWDPCLPISILDVGCGAGDICVAISRWAKKNNRDVHITGIDMVPEIVDIAKKNTSSFSNISIYQDDIFNCTEFDRYDIVLGCLFLHHIEIEKQHIVLQRFHQLARRGVIFIDLFRSPLSYVCVWLASVLFGNAIVRHDGPLSVKRAFTLEELRHLSHQAGLPYLQARQEPWFRVSLSGEK